MFPAGPEQQALDQSDPQGTSTASSRSQRSPPDPNSKLWIKVIPRGPQLQALDRSVPAGPEQQALDQSDPHWTSISIPQLQALDRSVPHQTSTANSGSNPAGPPPQAPDQSLPRQTSTASTGSEFCPPDRNSTTRYARYICQKESEGESQIECQNRYR